MSDEFTRDWITEQAVDVCDQYAAGVLTLRALHYQLVARGMTNSIQHYKRVVTAMIKARRNGTIPYEQFSDHDRESIGETESEPVELTSEIERAKQQIQLWMDSYTRNRWENQPKYVELWIEKKALQGVFGAVCKEHEVALCPCKGYPSLTFLHEGALRFQVAEDRGQIPTMIYFGDHDPSGEDIPRAIEENLACDFGISVDVQVIALTEEQCLNLRLPPAPVKSGDSRSASFTGLGQIELDAVPPQILQDWARTAITRNFNEGAHASLLKIEARERKIYQSRLRKFVSRL